MLSNKRANDEIKADRPTINELKFIPKLPISFFLENIRSVYNVGSIFRTADAMGASKVFLSGYTCYPHRKDLSKTALGSGGFFGKGWGEGTQTQLKFLSVQGMYKAIGFDKRNENYPQLTDHYFTGDYPVKPIDELGDSKITQLSLLSTASNN